ncbi:hypothetical protein QOZ84_02360 [Romboutsia sedimentorum]|jgi:hypothetical protein|uniref:Uncharacterized protein n=1 Tax=Romboutsia sedimentorum TaxID=1368474 RepID=A0ABT7E662_9FIRM|nr:hypothetical protein [Romboutsia sedimentorum]MDK2562377.1 hypothetical protein [Romboutsia sedimentorum]
MKFQKEFILVALALILYCAAMFFADTFGIYLLTPMYILIGIATASYFSE